MFTGIVQGIGTVRSIVEKKNFRTHVVEMPANTIAGLEIGASVAHNGCCLTVTAIQANHVSVDLMQETLRVTNLGSLKVGDRVNLERAARLGAEVGGHIMSGHIIGLATVKDVIQQSNNWTVWLEIPFALTKYIFTKGYIGVDGISLTIGEVAANRFCVHLIPETLASTTLSERQPGDHLNIEVDMQTQITVDTVERLLFHRRLS